MHDAVNTLGGRYGFVAKVHGTEYGEREYLWDSVPEPIELLALYDFEKRIELFALSQYERYCFANEAVSVKSRPNETLLSAKLFIGVKNGLADEVRVEFTPDRGFGGASRRTFPAAQLPYSPRSFRRGGLANG